MNTSCLAVCDILDIISQVSSFANLTRPCYTLQCTVPRSTQMFTLRKPPNNKKRPDDMDIDALIKKGKSHKGEGKSKTNGQKSSCFVCGRVGHMTKDCWFKDTSKGAPPINRGKKGKGKGKSKRKNSVNEVTESTVKPTGGTTASASQISRITQDDTWDRPHPQNADEEYENRHLGNNPIQRATSSVQGSVRCTRLGEQLCGRACVFIARLRMD